MLALSELISKLIHHIVLAYELYLKLTDQNLQILGHRR